MDDLRDDEKLSVGRRIRIYRRRRGLTQEVLAGLVGRTADWLGKVENDRLDVDRLSVLRLLADALGVAVSDLLPSIPPDRDSPEKIADRIGEALSQFELTSQATVALQVDEAPDEASVARRLGNLFADAQAGRFGRVTYELPLLLLDARALASVAPSGQPLNRAEAFYAMACNAAEFTLSKLRRVELAWLVSERGLAAADRSGDPIVSAALTRAVGHAIASNGAQDNASAVLTKGAETLLAQAVNQRSPELWSVYGTMFLAASMAEARLGHRDSVGEYLAEADRAAVAVGSDANHLFTAFGPTNVKIHVVATAMELGDVHIGAELGPSIDTRGMPIERRVRHALETARANQLLGRSAGATRILVDGWRQAPDQVENHFLARKLAITLLDAKGKPDPGLLALSKKMRIL